MFPLQHSLSLLGFCDWPSPSGHRFLGLLHLHLCLRLLRACLPLSSSVLWQLPPRTPCPHSPFLPCALLSTPLQYTCAQVTPRSLDLSQNFLLSVQTINISQLGILPNISNSTGPKWTFLSPEFELSPVLLSLVNGTTYSPLSFQKQKHRDHHVDSSP